MKKLLIFFLCNLDNFPFFIIFNNKDYKPNNINFLNQNQISNQNDFFFIKKIQKFFILENYIKIEEKPILGIFNSSLSSQIFNYIGIDETGKPKNYSTCILSIPSESKTLELLKQTDSIFHIKSKAFRIKNSIRLKYFYNLYNDKYIESNNIKYFFTLSGSHPEKFY